MAGLRRSYLLFAGAAVLIILGGIWVFANALTTGDNGDAQPVRDPDVFPAARPDDTRDARMTRESCSADQAVSWTEAVDHVGNQVTLIGPVLEVRESQDEVSLSIGSEMEADAPPPVEVVLTDNAQDDIAGSAVNVYGDGQVCVLGVIRSEQGNFRIVVNESEDILRL